VLPPPPGRWPATGGVTAELPAAASAFSSAANSSSRPTKLGSRRRGTIQTGPLGTDIGHPPSTPGTSADSFRENAENEQPPPADGPSGTRRGRPILTSAAPRGNAVA